MVGSKQTPCYYLGPLSKDVSLTFKSTVMTWQKNKLHFWNKVQFLVREKKKSFYCVSFIYVLWGHQTAEVSVLKNTSNDCTFRHFSSRCTNTTRWTAFIQSIAAQQATECHEQWGHVEKKHLAIVSQSAHTTSASGVDMKGTYIQQTKT